MLRRKFVKKGQAASQTGLAVFAVAVLIVLAVFFKVTTSVVHAQDIVQACHLSSVLASWQLQKDLLVMNWDIMDSPFSLDCKTIFTEITKDGVNRAEFPMPFGKDATPSEKKDKLKDAVMQGMAECWYMYGQGRAKVQQAVDTDGATACLVCSEIIPTEEFIKQMQDDNTLDVLKLDHMYAYAASNKVPPENSKYYLDYMLENAKTRPDMAEVEKHEPVIDLTKRYSIVFAVADQTEHPFALFNRGSVIKADTGIVGCYLGGYDSNPAKGDDANAIGCNDDGTNPDGLVFGKVIDGGRHDELLSWRNLVFGGGAAGMVGGVLSGQIGVELKRFPMTVRLVPTDKLANFCKRLY